jgi:hypothetical protein
VRGALKQLLEMPAQAVGSPQSARESRYRLGHHSGDPDTYVKGSDQFEENFASSGARTINPAYVFVGQPERGTSVFF